MVAYTRQHMNLDVIVPVLGVVTAAGAVTLAPIGWIEQGVAASGLAALFPPAEPPLGVTARAILCVAAASVAGLTLWFAMAIAPRRRRAVRGPIAGFLEAPSVRRADAHPDAPPRPPVIASRELGPPLMTVGVEQVDEVDASLEVEVSDIERPLPADLDTPLAAYRADMLATVPAGEAPPMPIARPAIFEPNERFETFELTPPVRSAEPPATDPIVAKATDASIRALLDRLEAGVARRASQRPTPHRANSDDYLAGALESLRKLAAQG